MSWDQDEELIRIFEGEVDERSARLVEGAAALSGAMLAPEGVEDLVRDGHSIKGSAAMMGRPIIAGAGAALERGWRHVEATGLDQPGSLVAALDDCARLLPLAMRDEALVGRLVEASALLDDRLDELGAAGVRKSAVEPGVPAVAEPAPEPTEPSGVTPLPSLESALEQDVPERPRIRVLDGADLGGLLGSIEEGLSGEYTRVDTAALYRMINRAVELGLDADALADLTHVAFEGTDPLALLAAWRDQLERLAGDVSELQAGAVALADVPLRDALETFSQLVKFVGRKLGKEVRFEAKGADVEVDRQIIDLLREPLRHLVVNAVDHGIEPVQRRLGLGKPGIGTVTLVAGIVDERLSVVVSDDGQGIDWDAVERVARARGLGTSPSELRAHLFLPGFSTVEHATDFSGTGEGLALIADAVDRVGGSVTIDSEAGLGTTVRVDLPASLVLQSVVIVAAGDQFVGVVEPAVVGTAALDDSTIRFADGRRELVFRGEHVPVVSFARALGLPERTPEHEALVISTRSGLIAAAVSEIIDRRRVAVKSLGPILEGAEHLTGAAFLGGGQVLVVVDHNHLGMEARRPVAAQGSKPRVLVVDDSAGVRQLLAATLRSRGFDVEVAPNARDAAREMAESRFDILVVDYSMPRSSGVQLVRALRHAGVELPIVMVSAVATEEDKTAAWEAGVNAFLDKYDLRRGALASTLRRLLEDGIDRKGA